MRAEPNITMVSPMPSFLSCTRGCRYSAKMRMGRAAVLSRNLGSWCGALGACWGFNLTCPGDMRFSPKDRTSILGIVGSGSNVGGRSCVELDPLVTEARHEETAFSVQVARGS